MALTVKDWKDIDKGAVVGVCTVEFAALRIHGVMLIRGKNGIFASLPSKPMLDREGKAIADENGKRRYEPVIEWRNRDTATKFSEDVIEALRVAGTVLI